MRFPLFIATRYFFSFRKRSFINFLSIISVLVVAVGSGALVVVLSAFNGMEDLIRQLYITFDPDLKIEAAEGKYFHMEDSLQNKLKEQEGVVSWSEVIEDNALLRYGEEHIFVRIKGVDTNYEHYTDISSAMVSGSFDLGNEKKPQAIIGQGIQYALGIPPADRNPFIQIWYPKDNITQAVLSGSGFRRRSISKAGVFALEKRYDDKYIFVPLHFAKKVLNYDKERTSIEVTVGRRHSIQKVQEALKESLGPDYRILDSDEQHESLLRAIRIEKLFVFLTFGFILFLASFNIFFSLSMLVIDKRKDIKMLFALGARPKTIRNIFIAEGSMIAFGGATIGLLLGLLLVVLQDKYGMIGMGMTSAVVQAYPVSLEVADLLLSGLLIFGITLMACIRPARRAARIAAETW